MPENKKPVFRYLTIDRCLTNTGRRWGYKELLEKVNDDLAERGYEAIGRTTFYNDIRDLETEFGAPIERYRDGNRVFFRYTDPDYSYANQPLNQEEIDHIRDAVIILSRFSGVPGFEWIDDVASKLELGTFEEVGDPNVIQFQSNEFLKGKEFIGPLFKAVVDKIVLEIIYQTFDADEEKTHLVHPYHLREYDDRWYVLGYLPKHDDLITLCVDRIKEIVFKSDVQYIENHRYDFVDYFEDFIGIKKEKGKEEEQIVLKFSPLMANYVETKPIHGSQKIVRREVDGSLIISLKLIINNELENTLFAFKHEMEVLEPESFKDRVKSIIQSMLKKYL